MIYVSLAENIDEAIPDKYKEKSKLLKKIIYFFRRKLFLILEKNIEDRKLYVLPNLNKKYIKKLNKIIKVRCVNTVVLSETLRKNNEFIEKISINDINILNGNWIYKYIEENILEAIVNLKNEKMYMQEVSILVNNLKEIDIDNIKNIAKKVRVLNIITAKAGMLKKVEKNIYEEEGILINVNNNYKKSLIKSDIIINEDFSLEELNNYNLPKKACIVNIGKNIKILSKCFEGINVLSFDINIPKRFIKSAMELKDFKSSILYESFIYKRTSIRNIRKEIENDKIMILNLYGQSGMIRKSEYKGLKNMKKIG
ncbi:MAG: hypothetical protein HFJ46_00320 [Clostridia bacterium]|nr:hypothetical protein [Clostridia bacterium]